MLIRNTLAFLVRFRLAVSTSAFIERNQCNLHHRSLTMSLYLCAELEDAGRHNCLVTESSKDGCIHGCCEKQRWYRVTWLPSLRQAGKCHKRSGLRSRCWERTGERARPPLFKHAGGAVNKVRMQDRHRHLRTAHTSGPECARPISRMK